jgi:hypothetical protein
MQRLHVLLLVLPGQRRRRKALVATGLRQRFRIHYSTPQKSWVMHARLTAARRRIPPMN